MTKILDLARKLLAGRKTYLAAAGLIGLAVYQASQGDYSTAVQTALAAITASGLRAAVAKNGQTSN